MCIKTAISAQLKSNCAISAIKGINHLTAQLTNDSLYQKYCRVKNQLVHTFLCQYSNCKALTSLQATAESLILIIYRSNIHHHVCSHIYSTNRPTCN